MSIIKKYFYVLICLIFLIVGCLFIVNHQSPDFYSYLIQDISKRDRHFETIEKVKYQDNLYFIVYQVIKLKVICLFMKVFRIYG